MRPYCKSGRERTLLRCLQIQPQRRDVAEFLAPSPARQQLVDDYGNISRKTEKGSARFQIARLSRFERVGRSSNQTGQIFP